MLFRVFLSIFLKIPPQEFQSYIPQAFSLLEIVIYILIHADKVNFSEYQSKTFMTENLENEELHKEENLKPQ